jgi:hypothetical protein
MKVALSLAGVASFHVSCTVYSLLFTPVTSYDLWIGVKQHIYVDARKMPFACNSLYCTRGRSIIDRIGDTYCYCLSQRLGGTDSIGVSTGTGFPCYVLLSVYTRDGHWLCSYGVVLVSFFELIGDRRFLQIQDDKQCRVRVPCLCVCVSYKLSTRCTNRVFITRF